MTELNQNPEETNTISPEEKAEQLQVALRKEREENRALKERLESLSKQEEPAKEEAPAPAPAPTPVPPPVADIDERVDKVLRQRDFDADLADAVQDPEVRKEVEKVFHSTFKDIPSDKELRKKYIATAMSFVSSELAPQTTTAFAGGSSASRQGSEKKEEQKYSSEKERKWKEHMRRVAGVE